MADDMQRFGGGSAAGAIAIVGAAALLHSRSRGGAPHLPMEERHGELHFPDSFLPRLKNRDTTLVDHMLFHVIRYTLVDPSFLEL